MDDINLEEIYEIEEIKEQIYKDELLMNRVINISNYDDCYMPDIYAKQEVHVRCIIKEEE